MTTPVPEALPTAYEYGRVIGRFLRAVGDGEDVDVVPEAVPATGTVTFTPIITSRILIDASAEPSPLITHESITCDLDAYGHIARNGVRGVWLWTGEWTVSFNVSGMSRTPFPILVTTAHTDLAPLDLWEAAPYTPPAGATVTTMLVPTNPTDGYVLKWSSASSSLVWGASSGTAAESVDWSDVTNPPATYTPTAHKTSHATGGTDTLTPADIGAAAADADLGGNFTSGTATAGQAPIADGAGAVAWGNVESGRPIATFTQADNTSVTVTAVDVDADTFTAVGHGLVNGARVIPFANNGVVVALRQYLPGGLICQRYYVIGAAADTFQLSLTSGGAAIDLTVRATMDLTKWHFETASSPFNGFTGLNGQRYRFLLRGQGLAEGNTYWVRVSVNKTSVITTSDSMASGGAHGAPTWMLVSVDVTFDLRGGRPSLTGFVRSIAQKTLDTEANVSSVNKVENAILAIASPAAITDLGMYDTVGQYYWANGTTMEVYA